MWAPVGATDGPPQYLLNIFTTCLRTTFYFGGFETEPLEGIRISPDITCKDVKTDIQKQGRRIISIDRIKFISQYHGTEHKDLIHVLCGLGVLYILRK